MCQYGQMCQDLIYTILLNRDLSLSFSICPQKVELHNDKWPQWNIEKRIVNSVITPLCSLSVSVSRTRGRIFHLGRQGEERDRNDTFFFLLQVPWYQASIGSWAWWQEAKEGWAGPKRRDQFQCSWSRDPQSPGRVSQGVPAECAEAGRLWSWAGEAGRLVL